MRIGLTAGGSKTQYYLNQAYVDYVAEAGFIPILITSAHDVSGIADICDGLLLPGGIDIEPTFYGENNLASNGCDPAKDDFEREVLHAFLTREKPIFGICRGFQMIVREFMDQHNDVPNAFAGLSYYQHINHHALAADRNIPRSSPSHSVTANFQTLYGQENRADGEHFVNSIHHQALVAKNDDSLSVIIDESTSPFSIASHNNPDIGPALSGTLSLALSVSFIDTMSR